MKLISVFPIHCEHAPPKPLSPRMKLFDPPRFTKNQEDPYPIPEAKHSFPVNLPPTPVVESEPISKEIDFGKVILGKKKFVHFKWDFRILKPVHFTYSLPKDPSIELLTPASIIVPNIPLRLKFCLKGEGTPRVINDLIKINTNEFVLVFKVTGEITKM